VVKTGKAEVGTKPDSDRIVSRQTRSGVTRKILGAYGRAMFKDPNNSAILNAADPRAEAGLESTNEKLESTQIQEYASKHIGKPCCTRLRAEFYSSRTARKIHVLIRVESDRHGIG